MSGLRLYASANLSASHVLSLDLGAGQSDSFVLKMVAKYFARQESLREYREVLIEEKKVPTADMG